jgi:hypothetical protein
VLVADKSYRYQGFSPSNSPNVIQWQWSDYNPVTSVTDAKVRCNGGKSATQSATAAPGDTISATWQQWTHSQGPIIVWLYKCSGAFSACDGSGSNWFKIDEGGFSGDGVKVFLDSEKPSGWEIAKLVGGNKQWSSKIPAGLAPGNYLVRHELIALHQANSPQFYPECAQLIITGTGSAQPDASFKTSIPGYAKQNDANIKVSKNGSYSWKEKGIRAGANTILLGSDQRPLDPSEVHRSRTCRLEGRCS